MIIPPPPCSSSLRCPCEEQPALGARPPAKPNLDDAAPGSPGAFSFLLRPLPSFPADCAPASAFSIPTGPEDCQRGFNQPFNTQLFSVHPSLRFSLFFFLFFRLVFTTSNLHNSFRRNNGVVLSCTFCGKIYSAVHQSVTHSSSLGLFSSILTTSRRPPPQLFGVLQRLSDFLESCRGGNAGISRPVSFQYLSASIYPLAA